MIGHHNRSNDQRSSMIDSRLSVIFEDISSSIFNDRLSQSIHRSPILIDPRTSLIITIIDHRPSIIVRCHRLIIHLPTIIGHRYLNVIDRQSYDTTIEQRSLVVGHKHHSINHRSMAIKHLLSNAAIIIVDQSIANSRQSTIDHPSLLIIEQRPPTFDNHRQVADYR